METSENEYDKFDEESTIKKSLRKTFNFRFDEHHRLTKKYAICCQSFRDDFGSIDCKSVLEIFHENLQ